jgi:hypothetical protein
MFSYAQTTFVSGQRQSYMYNTMPQNVPKQKINQ